MLIHITNVPQQLEEKLIPGEQERRFLSNTQPGHYVLLRCKSATVV